MTRRSIGYFISSCVPASCPRWTGWVGLIAAGAVILPFAEVFAIETRIVVIVGAGVV
ncbi:MAG: hypothetical protein MI924_19770 [Chloroflexales bacterium]|nr:hypothetical protein [Chloroflexales bacterium]